MTLLRNLSFRWKLLSLPALAAVGFLLMLLTVLATGSRSAGRLKLIEAGYVPSLELSRDLEETLQLIQRGMQDAVAAANLDFASGTDPLRDTFLKKVAAIRDNPVSDRDEAAQLEAAFRTYYVTASDTTRRMILRTGGEDLTASLEKMRSQYNQIRGA
jgi:methyl-accepting chemotaxis protein